MYMAYHFKGPLQDVQWFLCAALQSSLIWIHEILLFNTKTKMKLLLSMHPWVSFCTAELNMSPFPLLEEPWSLLFCSHPLWSQQCLRRASWGAWLSGRFLVITKISESWNLSLVRREVKLGALLILLEASAASLAGGRWLICDYVTLLLVFSKSDFQQLMSEISQISWVKRKNLLLWGIFSPLVLIFAFPLSAVSSFILITYFFYHRGV